MKNKITNEHDLSHLLPKFIERKINDIALLKKLLQQKEFEEIETIGHKMLGHSKTFGFAELSRMGETLMKRAEEHDEESIKKMIDAIEAYVEEVRIQLDSQKQSLKSGT